MKRMVKASYTVEAAIIFAFCFMVFGLAIGAAYHTFSEAVAYVQPKEDEFDAVKIFRGKEDLAELFKGKN